MTVNKSYCDVVEYIILDPEDKLVIQTKRQILKHNLTVQEICDKEIIK